MNRRKVGHVFCLINQLQCFSDYSRSLWLKIFVAVSTSFLPITTNIIICKNTLPAQVSSFPKPINNKVPSKEGALTLPPPKKNLFYLILTVIGLSCKDWSIKLLTTRPSLRCILGPNVLNILATLISVPSWKCNVNYEILIWYIRNNANWIL